MELDHIAPGLARWEVAHPEWKPKATKSSPNDWPQDVGCVAAMVGGRAVFIDPLLPEDPDELWPALDAFSAGAPVSVLTTIRFHQRSRAQLVERFEATEEVPPGVRPISVPDERMYWIAEYSTLVPGDRLIGDGQGGVRLCPESWLKYIEADPPVTHDDLRGALMQLSGLPIERILVSHGQPVLEKGQQRLAEALAD